MARVKLGELDDELVVTEPDPTRPELLPVDQLQPNPENPRPTDLEVAQMEESLRTQGQLQNINVMTRSAFLDRKPHLAARMTSAPYVVVTGRRRLAAAPGAGLAGLKYELHDEWTAQQIDIAIVLENEDRLDVNPLHLGRFLARMLKDYGSHRQLAAALGKRQAWVSQRIGLTTLHPDLQAAIDTGQVLFTLARECTRLAPELQLLLASGELPPDVAHAWVVTLRLKKDEQIARWQAGPPYDVTHRAAELAPPAANEPVPNDQDAGAGAKLSPEPATDSEKPRAIVIRITERSPAAVAGALRQHFNDEEIRELVAALTGVTLTALEPSSGKADYAPPESPHSH